MIYVSFDRKIVLFPSVAIGIAIGIYIWRLRKISSERKKNTIPINWKQVGTVEKLIIYPLKSGAPKELQKAECTELGARECTMQPENRLLLYDRSFIIYNALEKTVLKLIKNTNAILLLAENINEDIILFHGPKVEDYYLKLSQVILSPKIIIITSYDTDVQTLDCGDNAAKWVTKYLTGVENTTYRLGLYWPNVVQRPDPISAFQQVEMYATSVYSHWRQEDGGIYSWLSSYMIVSSSSINDLNARLSTEDQFTYAHLRPNIVIVGCEKYAEDKWEWIKIGDTVVLRFLKLCTRCLSITVDPRTGRRNRNFEPLKTLRSYRTMKTVTGNNLQGDKAVLGVNMGLYVPGKIQIGEPVYTNI